jgi:hypothetical protein
VSTKTFTITLTETPSELPRRHFDIGSQYADRAECAKLPKLTAQLTPDYPEEETIRFDQRRNEYIVTAPGVSITDARKRAFRLGQRVGMLVTQEGVGHVLGFYSDDETDLETGLAGVFPHHQMLLNSFLGGMFDVIGTEATMATLSARTWLDVTLGDLIRLQRRVQSATGNSELLAELHVDVEELRRLIAFLEDSLRDSTTAEELKELQLIKARAAALVIE